jgi:hypothetical protein
MGRLFSFLGLFAAVAAGAYLYSHQAQSILSSTNTSAPGATVNVIGIQNDLLALANAERRHFAQEGKYVSLDELSSSGDISWKANSRGPCAYNASVAETSFRITATCSGQAAPGTPRTFSIDETMQTHSD